MDDKTIEAAFLQSVNQLISEKDAISADYEAIKDMLFSTEEFSAKEAELRQEMEVVSKMIQDCINENDHVALDQTDFHSRYESLVRRFDDTKASYDAVCAEMDDKRIRRATVEQFLADLAKTRYRDDGVRSRGLALAGGFCDGLWRGGYSVYL